MLKCLNSSSWASSHDGRGLAVLLDRQALLAYQPMASASSISEVHHPREGAHVLGQLAGWLVVLLGGHARNTSSGDSRPQD